MGIAAAQFTQCLQLQHPPTSSTAHHVPPPPCLPALRAVPLQIISGFGFFVILSVSTAACSHRPPLLPKQIKGK